MPGTHTLSFMHSTVGPKLGLIPLASASHHLRLVVAPFNREPSLRQLEEQFVVRTQPHPPLQRELLDSCTKCKKDVFISAPLHGEEIMKPAGRERFGNPNYFR